MERVQHIELVTHWGAEGILMIATFETEGNVEGLRRTLAAVQTMEGVQGLLVLACDANGFDKREVDPVLVSLDLPIFGGIFPGILYNGQKYTTGTLVIGLDTTPQVAVVHDLSRVNAAHDEILESFHEAAGASGTMMVWVDGLSSRIGALIATVFEVLGHGYSFIGGGAGSLTFNRKPCLITNDGLIEDAAILAAIDMRCGIGVSHGWKSIAGPFKVTESHGSTIVGLDWQPAFNVYRHVVERHSGKIFDDDFFALAKRYPYGLYRAGAERIIRNPIQRTEDGRIVCVGEVPEDSYIDIMHGTVESLVEAARNARTMAVVDMDDGSGEQVTFVIDCVSRQLFLEDNFVFELQAVRPHEGPMFGALTLGEIANNRQDYLEFFNKTIVIGIFPS